MSAQFVSVPTSTDHHESRRNGYCDRHFAPPDARSPSRPPPEPAKAGPWVLVLAKYPAPPTPPEPPAPPFRYQRSVFQICVSGTSAGAGVGVDDESSSTGSLLSLAQ
jgi:hypothetical protein